MDIRCSVFIATSVDGFIARPDGDIDWLHNPEYACSRLEGLVYEDFIATVDALVMGRKTFEKVLSFPEWPYQDKPVVVLSNSIVLPDHLRENVQVRSGAPERIVAQLASEGRKHLYVDGGVTIQHFLKAGLINEITLTRIPVLLGQGIALFSHIGAEQKLRLIGSAASANGFVQERYEVQRAG